MSEFRDGNGNLIATVGEDREVDAILKGSVITLATTVSTTGLNTANQEQVGYNSSLRLNVWGTASSFDLQVQGQMFDGLWYTLVPSNSITGAALASNDVTAAGIYDFDVAGFQWIALKVVSVAGGNVNAKGVLLP